MYCPYLTQSVFWDGCNEFNFQGSYRFQIVDYKAVIVLQCSLKDCGWRTEDSSVEEFKHKYLAIHNASQTFQCYCDQLDNGKCVDHKKYSEAGAIHSLVWPFIFLVFGIVLLIITRCGCPDKYFRRNQYYEVH